MSVAFLPPPHHGVDLKVTSSDGINSRLWEGVAGQDLEEKCSGVGEGRDLAWF